jgi:PAS domain S-box-containing protein
LIAVTILSRTVILFLTLLSYAKIESARETKLALTEVSPNLIDHFIRRVPARPGCNGAPASRWLGVSAQGRGSGNECLRSRSIGVRHPLGVVASFTPSNGANVLPWRAVISPVAAGNTVVVMPSEFAPVSGIMVAGVADESRFPAGLINVVTHASGAVGSLLARATQEYNTTMAPNGDGAFQRDQTSDLQLLLDSAPSLIHTGRSDGYLDFFNQTWLTYVGRSLEDMQGWNWTAVIHPEDVEGILEKWRASLASGEPFLYEARVQRADGEYRWMLHHKVAVRDGSGQIVKWHGSSFDIEDRKRSEFYLAEGQRLAHTGSWAFDPAGFDYWSP